MPGSSLTSWVGVSTEPSGINLLRLGELGKVGCPLEDWLHVKHTLLRERAPWLLGHEQVGSEEEELDSTSSRLGSPSLFIIFVARESLIGMMGL